MKSIEDVKYLVYKCKLRVKAFAYSGETTKMLMMEAVQQALCWAFDIDKTEDDRRSIDIFSRCVVDDVHLKPVPEPILAMLAEGADVSIEFLRSKISDGQNCDCRAHKKEVANDCN